MPVTHTKQTTSDQLAAEYSEQIKGKVILTTGVTIGGIGSVFVKSIASAKPAVLILAGRTKAKLEETADAILSSSPDVTIKQLVLDLGSMAAVRKAAEEVNSWDDVAKIDVLVNNGGIMNVPYELTSDGFELQLATNYIGHFLFTNLIMPKILAADQPRVVIVGSDAHRLSPLRWGDLHFDNGKLYNGWAAYGQSKTAIMLLALSMAEKLEKHGLLTFAVHPGVIFATNLGKHLDPAVDIPNLVQYDRQLGNVTGFAAPLADSIVSVEQGAATYIYAAFEPSLRDHNGAYLLENRLADPEIDIVRPWATSLIEANLFWKRSEELVGQKFQY